MDDSRQVLHTEAGTKLSREQKAGFVFVIVCGFLALVLGGQYLWTHMAEPFAINYTGPRFLTGAEEEAAAMAEQRRADTDADTVSDYDELYIYKTSPYLADSDSDGITDGAEISAGQDPNCITGSDCASVANEDIQASSPSAALEAEGASLEERQQVLVEALTELYSLQPAEIRQMMLESGADPAEVEALSDEDVSAMYKQILSQLEQQGEIQKLIPPELLGDSTP
ncbi:MAG: thrombospondin type 3 repeat-containing protein [Patescibacteria group bacterium]